MRKTKIFKEPNSYEKMTEWAKKNNDKFQMDIIFIENGYGIEYKPLIKEPYRRSVKTLKSIIDDVEKEGKRPSTAYYSAKAELEGYNRK